MSGVESRSSIKEKEPFLTAPEMAYKRDTMPSILTVRLTKEEQRLLAKRSKRAGMKKATFVRKLIRDEEIITGADLLLWAERHAGDERLRITPRK
ncbi:MAG TPA: hypothetical protein VNV15_05860 [Opitutaceae bacterium]|jgi:hypothetical protein|nr:hypothetical protein [Opitutaceae bacterium]